MKVSIIGHGFVGKALENALNNSVETLIIDPIYKNKISDITLFEPDCVFICVPTPMADGGNQDLSILDESNSRN
jgi:Predicted UDP-glucose 6-dehydrogenase